MAVRFPTVDRNLRNVYSMLKSHPLCRDKKVTTETMREFEDLLNQVIPLRVQESKSYVVKIINSARGSVLFCKYVSENPHVSLLLKSSIIANSLGVADSVSIRFNPKEQKFEVKQRDQPKGQPSSLSWGEC